MAQPKPNPATRPGTMAQDSSLPRTGLHIPMPAGAKPPPTSTSQKPTK
jgi:hypothetical protein